MDLDFYVDSVAVDVVTAELEKLSCPLFFRPHLEIKESDFFINVRNVASYRVQNGDRVHVHPHENADIESIKLFLNGSVLGAVLHQKGILPFHGCSFEYNGQGIIISGLSGSGKSSVTTAFCQNGGRFINDDITPVQIGESVTTILPIKTKIKLWDDSLRSLNIKNDNLQRIRPSMDKFYISLPEKMLTEQPLNHIFILAKHNEDIFKVNELSGMAKYNVLRNQIYRKSYLKGMPETSKAYFKQLCKLAQQIRITQVIRPQICSIYDTMNFIKQQIV